LIGRVVACGYAPLKPLGYCRGAYVTFGLEERFVTAGARKTCVGAILERDGCVLIVKNPSSGEFVLPTAVHLGQPHGKEGLYGVLQSLGVNADLSFVFSIFEDAESGEVSIYYRGIAVTEPRPVAPAQFIPFDAIPWQKLSNDAVRT